MKKALLTLISAGILIQPGWADLPPGGQIVYQKINISTLDEAKLKEQLKPGDPRRINTLILLGKIAINKNDEQAAETYFKQALSDIKDSPEQTIDSMMAMLNLGTLYTSQFKFAESKTYFDRAMAIVPSLPKTHNYLIAQLYGGYGGMLFLTGHLEEAKAFLEKGLSYDTNSQECKFFLDEIAKEDQGADYLQSLDPQIRRWNDETHIILVYLGRGNKLKDWNPSFGVMAQKAFSQWQEATNNRFEFQYVDDEDKADVRIQWQKDPISTEGEGSAGENLIQVNPENQYIIANDICITLQKKDKTFRSSEEMYSTLLHEIGHMLGINGHSPNTTDLMAFDSTNNIITKRDIATLNAIYSLKPTYTTPTGISLGKYRNQLRQEFIFPNMNF